MLSGKILASIPYSIRTLRRLSAGSLQSNLTFQQFRILTLISEGLSQTQMVQILQVSGAAVSKIVDSLVKKELIWKTLGEDRRCHELRLTKEGERLQKLVRSGVEFNLQKNLSYLSKKEQGDLSRGLDVLDKLMGLINEN